MPDREQLIEVAKLAIGRSWIPAEKVVDHPRRPQARRRGKSICSKALSPPSRLVRAGTFGVGPPDGASRPVA